MIDYNGFEQVVLVGTKIERKIEAFCKASVRVACTAFLFFCKVCSGIGLSSGFEQAVPAAKKTGRKGEAFFFIFFNASVMVICSTSPSDSLQSLEWSMIE